MTRVYLFNLIGQIAITAGIDYGAAIFTTALLNRLWPGSFPATPHTIIYDRATPGHQLWRRLNGDRVPYLAALGIATLAFLCAFPA
jgi:hypothetical protein